MTMSRSSRRLNFAQRRLLANMMEQEAVDGVIKVSTIKEYVARLAHVLSMDSIDLSADTVTRLADEIGVALITTDSSQRLKSSALLQRIIVLESRHADLVKQHEALSAIHNTVAQVVAGMDKRVDDLERLYVEMSANVVTVTEENAADVARMVRSVEKRHDKHR